MGERSELFWLRAIASLAQVFAPLSVSEAEQARLLVINATKNHSTLPTAQINS